MIVQIDKGIKLNRIIETGSFDLYSDLVTKGEVVIPYEKKQYIKRFAFENNLKVKFENHSIDKAIAKIEGVEPLEHTTRTIVSKSTKRNGHILDALLALQKGESFVIDESQKQSAINYAGYHDIKIRIDKQGEKARVCLFN